MVKKRIITDISLLRTAVLGCICLAGIIPVFGGNACRAAASDYILSGPESSNPLGTQQYWLDQYAPQGAAVILNTDSIGAINSYITGRIDPADGRIYRADLLSENKKLLDYNDNEFSKAVSDMINNTTGSWSQISENVGEYYYNGHWITEEDLNNLLANRNVSNASKTSFLCLGVVTQRANLRILPTDMGIYDDETEVNTHYDNMQASVLDPAEGVIILNESKDGQYYYVMANDYTGWVLKSNVALVNATDASQRELWNQFAAVNRVTQSPSQYATVIANKMNSNKISSVDALYQMGANMTLNSNNELQLPIRDVNGKLTINYVALSSLVNTNNGTEGALAYTDNNIIQQSFKFLNDEYGWGGQDNSVDCSSFVQDVYGSMGIELPRDADLQPLACPQRLDLSELTHEQRMQLFKDLKLPVGSLIGTSGHIMLYLGNDANGRPVVINSLSSYYPDGQKQYIRRVAVTYADFPSSDNVPIIDKANSIAFIRPSVENLYTTTEANTGLHMYGNNHSLIQAANITNITYDSVGGSAASDNYVGIKLSGIGNTITIDNGTAVKVSGAGSIGLLADGRDLNININGTLQSDAEAIRITEAASVKNIDIGSAGVVSGAMNATGTLKSFNNAGTYNQTAGAFTVNGDVMNSGSMTLKGNATVQGTMQINQNAEVYIGGVPVIQRVAGNSAAASKLTITSAGLADPSASIGNASNLSINVANSGDSAAQAAANNDNVFANLNSHASKIKNITDSTVSINEGRIAGAAVISYDGAGKAAINEAPNKNNANISAAMTTDISFGRVEMNDIRRRMGEVRLANGQDGIWFRMENGRFEGSGIAHNFHKYQIGSDRAFSEKWRAGYAFSYTSGMSAFSTGNIQNAVYSLAAYGIYTGKKGEFADIIARFGFSSNDINTNAVNGTITRPSFAVSGEIGKTYSLKHNFFIEPQAEIMYSHTNGDSFTDSGASFGMSSMDSFNGRLGFAIGYRAPDNKGLVYTRLSVLHDFTGNSVFTAANDAIARRTPSNGGQTWYEWGIGGQLATSKATYIYADIEKTFGADINEKYRLNIGMRYSF